MYGELIMAFLISVERFVIKRRNKPSQGNARLAITRELARVITARDVIYHVAVDQRVTDETAMEVMTIFSFSLQKKAKTRRVASPFTKKNVTTTMTIFSSSLIKTAMVTMTFVYKENPRRLILCVIPDAIRNCLSFVSIHPFSCQSNS
jgi:hypothetical protein